MIKLLISDFDGTLADTFQPNYEAYREALAAEGIHLGMEDYRGYFGFRFDRFMDALGVHGPEVRQRIRDAKSEAYTRYFDTLRPNTTLLEFIRQFHASGGKTAIASTARERNLLAALEHIGGTADFDLVMAGESVQQGKPHPEIYLKVLEKMGVKAHEALVFEDSEVGFAAARAAGIACIPVKL